MRSALTNPRTRNEMRHVATQRFRARLTTFVVAVFILAAFLFPAHTDAQRQMEGLGRGVVAVHQADGSVFVGWRLLGTDPDALAFNLYRTAGDARAGQAQRQAARGPTNFVDEKADASQAERVLRPPRARRQGAASRARRSRLPANAPARPYLSIPLQTPPGYTPERRLGRRPRRRRRVRDRRPAGVGRRRDNSQRGRHRPSRALQAYKLDGTLLWPINLGKNIREGAHYTQFMVYDLDGDGRAEVACKTADGTIDGAGQGDRRRRRPTTATPSGYVLDGPEFLTVFDGLTGAALATTDYVPPPRLDARRDRRRLGRRLRQPRRSLPGVRRLPRRRAAEPRHVPRLLHAHRARRLGLARRQAHAASGRSTATTARRQHAPTAGRAITTSASATSTATAGTRSSTARASSTTTARGSTRPASATATRCTSSDLDPARPGLEVFDIQERFDDAGAHFRDARTGEDAVEEALGQGGRRRRGAGARPLSRHRPAPPRLRVLGARRRHRRAVRRKGEQISKREPRSCNFGVWWDGDLLRELLDRNDIAKWDWKDGDRDRAAHGRRLRVEQRDEGDAGLVRRPPRRLARGGHLADGGQQGAAHLHDDDPDRRTASTR